MTKRELCKLIASIVFLNIVVLASISHFMPNVSNLLQCSIYLIVIFLLLLLYMRYIMKKYSLNENYRNIIEYRKARKIIALIISGIIIVLITFNYAPELNSDIIEFIIKLVVSSGIGATIITAINSHVRSNDLIIQIFNIAPYYGKGNSELIISNDIEEFTLSLHNFSENSVQVFFLGICDEKGLSSMFNEKDWNKNFWSEKGMGANLPKESKSLEEVKPNGDSETKKINVKQLENFFAKDSSCEGKKYKLCAVYYVQEGKNVNLITAKKHFTLECGKKEKLDKNDEKDRVENLINETHNYQLAMQIRNYAASISDKVYKNWALQEADRFDPNVSKKDSGD